MRISKKIFAGALTLLLALSLFTPTLFVNAATLKNTYRASVGHEAYFPNVTDLKINNKAVKKFKKNVEVAKEGVDPKGLDQVTKEYKAGKAKHNYKKTSSYLAMFLKPGSYTFSYKRVVPKNSYNFNYVTQRLIYNYTITYYADDSSVLGTTTFTSNTYLGGSEVYSRLDATYTSAPTYDEYHYTYTSVPEEVYSLTVVDNTKETSKVDSSQYVKKYDANQAPYYVNNSGKMYAQSQDIDAVVPVKLTSNVITYKPLTYTTVNYKTTYKVSQNYERAVKSVKLGNASYSTVTTNYIGGSKTETFKQPFLKGKSGKITVVPGKNYQVMDIVVVTYNKDGTTKYQHVQNNKKVTYGNYLRETKYTYSASNVAHDSFSTEMFKQTQVYVFFKDKTSGNYVDIEKISKNKQTGIYTFKYKTKNGKGKAVSETSTYLPYSYCATYTFYK